MCAMYLIYAKLFCCKYDREFNLHFEVETRLICLFDGAAVNIYKLFISIYMAALKFVSCSVTRLTVL